MPTQAWLSILIHPCRVNKNPRQGQKESYQEDGCQPQTSPNLSSLKKIPSRYHKEKPQSCCIVEGSFASINPEEYCRKNGFERPLNMFQLLSWAFFGIDIVLFYIVLTFSLSVVAAVSFLITMKGSFLTSMLVLLVTLPPVDTLILAVHWEKYCRIKDG